MMRHAGSRAAGAAAKGARAQHVRGMAKDVKFGVHARAAMLAGVERLADAVRGRGAAGGARRAGCGRGCTMRRVSTSHKAQLQTE
jgi:hypothetical protein